LHRTGQRAPNVGRPRAGHVVGAQHALDHVGQDVIEGTVADLHRDDDGTAGSTQRAVDAGRTRRAAEAGRLEAEGTRRGTKTTSGLGESQ